MEQRERRCKGRGGAKGEEEAKGEEVQRETKVNDKLKRF